MTFSDKEKKIVGIIFAACLVVFFFINIPKIVLHDAKPGQITLGGVFVALLIFSAFYALCVVAVKALYIDKKKTNSL